MVEKPVYLMEKTALASGWDLEDLLGTEKLFRRWSLGESGTASFLSSGTQTYTPSILIVPTLGAKVFEQDLLLAN